MLDDTGNFHIPPKLKEQLLRMVQQEIMLVPTLDVIVHDDYLQDGVRSEGDLVSRAVLDVVRFFHEAGGTIALGNDYGNGGIKPGMPLREMELLHVVGLSPMEIMEAATRHAAYVCGQGEELGTLEPGRLADIIVVQGNPLDDIAAMDAILFVVKDGELVALPE